MLTGEPDAGDPHVRFGGRGGAIQCVVPTPILDGKYLDRLSARQSSRQRSAIPKRRTRTTELAARHISAVTLEAELRWNFVVSLVASFVAASRSRFVTIRPVVSALFDPASVSLAGGPADLKFHVKVSLVLSFGKPMRRGSSPSSISSNVYRFLRGRRWRPSRRRENNQGHNRNLWDPVPRPPKAPFPRGHP